MPLSILSTQRGWRCLRRRVPLGGAPLALARVGVLYQRCRAKPRTNRHFKRVAM